MTSELRLRLRLLRRLEEPARRVVRARRSLPRHKQRIRRAVRVRYGRARMLAEMLAACSRRERVFLVLDDLRALTPAVRRALRTAHLARTPAEVVVLDFHPDVANGGTIPGGLPVRRFWLDAAPGGGGARPQYSTAGLVRGPVAGEDESEWLDGWYADGRPAYVITEHRGGTVVDHYGDDGLPTRSEQLDSGGALVRIVDLHPTTGEPTTHRYFDADDACWLSVWITENGAFDRTQQHRGEQREFPSLREAQAAWLKSLTEGSGRSRVFTSGRAAAEVAGFVGD